jgi:hypothetical protein
MLGVRFGPQSGAHSNARIATNHRQQVFLGKAFGIVLGLFPAPPATIFPTAALHGSSHYDLPAVLRGFTANIGVRHVHHLCSRIPFYRLPLALRQHPGWQMSADSVCASEPCMRTPRALGRGGEPAHFVPRAASSARSGRIGWPVTAPVWFLTRAHIIIAQRATLTSYVGKSTLAGQSGRFAFAECPGARSDPSKHRRSNRGHRSNSP